MTQMTADGVLGNEQPLSHLSVGQTLGDKPRYRKLGVGHGGPTCPWALRRHQTAAHAQGPEPAAYPAGIPGRSRLGIQLQRLAENLNGCVVVATAGGGDPQVLERRGVGQWTRAALVQRDRFRKVRGVVVHETSGMGGGGGYRADLRIALGPTLGRIRGMGSELVVLRGEGDLDEAR